MIEEFRECFENYEISNLGNCRRKLKNGEYKIVNGSIMNRGYKYFQINRNNKRTNFLFHQMVAKCFIGDRNGLDTDHIDRNKLNNNVTNLRYISHQENSCNRKEFIEEIPIGTEDRTKKVVQVWTEKNREIILNKKHEYYIKNIDKFTEYNKIKNSKEHEIKCSLCNNFRTIKNKMYEVLERRGDINLNICSHCNTLKLNKMI